MIRFNNDYNHGAHPEILEALSAVNDNSFGGYGEDEWCKKAADLIRERVHCPDAAIHFFPGATQANFIVIASALSSVQSVIAADTGHINCHEAASVENTNHKIQTIPNTDGKSPPHRLTHAPVLIMRKTNRNIIQNLRWFICLFLPNRALCIHWKS